METAGNHKFRRDVRKMKREVQIVASGAGWQEFDVSKEIWILLKPFLKCGFGTRIFSMDGFNINLVESGKITKEQIIEKIGDIEFTTNENFPMDDIPEEQRYFTNSVCYMIAMAILEGYERVELYGVNQMGLFEYMEQRRGVEFWVGYALGRGIEVVINEPSKLLTNSADTPYGYEKSEGLKAERKAKGGIKKVIDLVGYVQGIR